MFLGVAIHATSECFDIFPSFGSLDLGNHCTLLVVERHMNMCAQLEPNIDSVDERHITDVKILDTEEVTFPQTLVGCGKRTTETRKSRLNLALDTRIFDDVQETLKLGVAILDGIMPTLLRSFKRMTDFVTHEQIVQVAVHVLPHRADERTVLQVKICRLGVLV